MLGAEILRLRNGELKMEDGEWNVRFQSLLRIENTPNLWFGVRLSRNYSFADKQERTVGRSKVVRKFLYRNFLPPEVQKWWYMLPLFEHLQSKCYFMRAAARNTENCWLYDFFDRLTPNLRFGVFFDWVQFQKKTVNYRVNFPFSILHPQFYIYSK